MTSDQAEEIVQLSIVELFERDRLLLTNDVSERAITHKLAQYVQAQVERIGIVDVHVDCEYNRNLEDGPLEPKRVQFLEQQRQDELQRDDLSEDDWRSVTTFPDIIVHRRGDNGRNLLSSRSRSRRIRPARRSTT